MQESFYESGNCVQIICAIHYHGDHGLRTLKERVRSYLTITKDLSRVVTRVKAIYRGWATPCTGKQVYAPRHRAEWLAKINESGVRRRAEFYYQQLDALRSLRREVRKDLLAESKKHKIWKRLCEIPSIGPIRAAVLLGILQTPHRFRTKRQLWTYSGLGIEVHSSADHQVVKGQLQRRDSRTERELQSRSEECVRGMWSSTFLECEVARNVELVHQGLSNRGFRYLQLHIS
jgi:transposase